MKYYAVTIAKFTFVDFQLGMTLEDYPLHKNLYLSSMQTVCSGMIWLRVDT